MIVVGTGIRLAGQLSAEARSAIERADLVLSLMGDPLLEAWLGSLNSRLEPLEPLYAQAGARPKAYRAMVERMLEEVRSGKRVCAAFYGHPGVFVTPSHEAIRRAREEGYEAMMLPAVSAEDCLFADLGFDPGASGCQSYEARDFFVNPRLFDPSAALILWQIAVLGDGRFVEFTPRPAALKALSLVLSETYPAEHEVMVYVAPVLANEEARIERVALNELCRVEVEQGSTLFVPPLGPPASSPARLALLEAMLAEADGTA